MSEQSPNNIHISIGGDQSGQFALGDNNTQQSTTLINSQNTAYPSSDELAQLRQIFANLKAQLETEAPAEKKSAAMERINELEEEVMSEKPDLTTMKYIQRWFTKNMPTFAGLVTGVLVNPTVGKLVEAVGTVAAEEFFQSISGD